MSPFLELEEQICTLAEMPVKKHFLPTLHWDRDEILISDILISASAQIPIETLEQRIKSKIDYSLLPFLKFYNGFIHILRGFPGLENVSEDVSLSIARKDCIALPHANMSLIGFMRLASLGFLRSFYLTRIHSAVLGQCTLGGGSLDGTLSGFLERVCATYDSRVFESFDRLSADIEDFTIVYLSNQTLERKSFNIFYNQCVAGKNVTLKTMPKKWIEGSQDQDEKTLHSLINSTTQQNLSLLHILATDIEAAYLDFENVALSDRSHLFWFHQSVHQRMSRFNIASRVLIEPKSINLQVRLNFFNRVLEHALSTGSVEKVISHVDMILFEILCFLNEKSFLGQRDVNAGLVARINEFLTKSERMIKV